MDKNKNVCRICLEHEVTLNWNEELFEFCGVTYKDCYYHCTQLDETDADSFSAMLCKTCSEELKNAHFLINKALESFRILQQTFAEDYLRDEELKDSSKAIKLEAIETIIDHDETILDDVSEIQPSLLSQECLELKEDKVNMTNETSLILRKSIRKTSNQSSSSIHNRSKSKPKNSVMCAYCSVIVPNISQLRRHEETHDKNRARKEVCPHCGLKFYIKGSLKSHILTHKENREKKHNCEFCDKAYFNRGSLNFHRRIHLGLMIKCTLCPKEFFRQLQLDRHMASHSIIPLSQVKTTKYVVHCKDCNSQIASKRWNAHKAFHKNEPQLKCKICNRDFFSRKSCINHIKTIHNKTLDEYETYIHYYVERRKMRVSHLMLKQFETIKPTSNICS